MIKRRPLGRLFTSQVMDLKLGCNVRHHWLIASSSILIATAVSTSETALAQGNTNMQGVSGLFNVPDASVIEFGKASLSFDRQVDGRTSADPRLNDSGNDIVFGAGVFPHVEVAGRNVTGESTSGSSDLSFNTIISQFEYLAVRPRPAKHSTYVLHFGKNKEKCLAV